MARSWRELKDRIIVSSNDLPFPLLSSASHNVRPSTYKSWDDSVMAQALNTVVTEGLSIREAGGQSFWCPQINSGGQG